MTDKVVSNLELGADEAYMRFKDRMGTHFLSQLMMSDLTLFTTDADITFDKYLSLIPEGVRQYHNCTACRHFINRYGNLAAIGADGTLTSALWEESTAHHTPEVRNAILEFQQLVRKARVTGVFYSKENTLGLPYNEDKKRGCTWDHLAVTLPNEALYRHSLNTAGQGMAEKKEEYGAVCRALGNYTFDTLTQAVALLSTDSLYGSESVLGQAKWLLELYNRRSILKGYRRENVTWQMIAKAPAGFCHPGSSMIGTLLDDLGAGLPVGDVKRKFDAKMDSLKYQRPQALPTLGNVEQAEKVVAQLGLAPALRRRIARLDETEKLWEVPRVDPAKEAERVFEHLKQKPAKAGMIVPMQRSTWVKFERDVLPKARSIELQVPAQGNFAAMTTAVYADAPPLLQWDGDPRNPVSWYIYHSGSSASRWGLIASRFVPVLAICEQPSMWFGGHDKFAHQGWSLFFILEGCRDTVPSKELAIFPAHVRSELHAHRSVIEAYSKSRPLDDTEKGPLACGLKYEGGKSEVVLVRVDVGDKMRYDYILDRRE